MKNSSDNNLEKYEVEDSYKVDFIIDFTLSILTSTWPLLLFLFLFYFKPQALLDFEILFVIFFFMGFFYVLWIPSIRKFFKKRYPIYSVKFIITNEFIEIQIQNHSYLKFLWADIKKIEVINETFYPWSGSKNSYKLKIIVNNYSKEVRLFILLFHKKTARLILKSLEEFSRFLKKKFIRVKEVEKRDYFDKQQLSDLSDIRTFQNNLKVKKRK